MLFRSAASNVTISGGTSSQWANVGATPAIYVVANVAIGASSGPTANLQVTGNAVVTNSVTTTNNWVLGVSKLVGTNNLGYLPGVLRQEYLLSNTTAPPNQSGFDLVMQTATRTTNSWTLPWINQSSTPNGLTTYFSWIYTGSIYISTAGSYTFVTNSDDASDVFIDYPVGMDPRYTTGNAVPVTTYYGAHGTGGGGISGTLTLSAGFHTVMYRLQQGGGGYGACLL